MATENRRDRRRIEDWGGATTSSVIDDGQYRWYDGVTGYNAAEIIEIVGNGSATIAAGVKHQPITDGAQTLYGVKTFDDIPVLPAAAPTSANQAISKVHAEALVSLPAGFIYGLETVIDTDTDHDVLIAIGKCRDFGDTTSLALTSAMTKQIDATWAAGDDAGGMFTGTVAADTTYHLFLIKKDSDASSDAGWDTDIDCSNIPSGYTEYRRIASFITNASSNIIPTDQSGDSFTLRSRSQNLSTAIPATSNTALSLTVPTGIKTIAKIGGRVLNTANALIGLGPTTMTGQIPTVMRTNSGGTVSAGAWDIDADTSGQVLYICDDGALSSNLVFETWGWYDTRGIFGGK